MSLRFAVALLWLLLVAPGATKGVDLVLDHVLTFPHVVAGNLGDRYVESVLCVVNPTGEAIGVDLSGFPEARTLELEPFEAREVRISADDYRAGALRVSSPAPFAADLTIVVKPSGASPASPEILVAVAIPGRTPSPKVATPVRVGTALAGDTGIALAAWAQQVPDRNQYLTFVLHDSAGNEVGRQTRPYGQPYLAMFVTELFPDLPESFASGWMSVEVTEASGESANRAIALSLVSIYTRGAELFTAGATAVDAPGGYAVYLDAQR